MEPAILVLAPAVVSGVFEGEEPVAVTGGGPGVGAGGGGGGGGGGGSATAGVFKSEKLKHTALNTV
tara:strand:+ start:783 stop:980 length:198 start_codon:yes stop_codon:yes gene_type:complete